MKFECGSDVARIKKLNQRNQSFGLHLSETNISEQPFLNCFVGFARIHGQEIGALDHEDKQRLWICKSNKFEGV